MALVFYSNKTPSFYRFSSSISWFADNQIAKLKLSVKLVGFFFLLITHLYSWHATDFICINQRKIGPTFIGHHLRIVMNRLHACRPNFLCPRRQFACRKPLTGHKVRKLAAASSICQWNLPVFSVKSVGVPSAAGNIHFSYVRRESTGQNDDTGRFKATAARWQQRSGRKWLRRIIRDDKRIMALCWTWFFFIYAFGFYIFALQTCLRSGGTRVSYDRRPRCGHGGS